MVYLGDTVCEDEREGQELGGKVKMNPVILAENSWIPLFILQEGHHSSHIKP